MNRNAWLKRAILHTATLGPVGYLPAPGTCGTIASIPLVHGVRYVTGPAYEPLMLLVLGVFSLIATHIAASYFPYQDPPEIVIDETIGYAVAIYHIPDNFRWTLFIAFILFRVFDIGKLLYITYAERLPGAYGVVADDVVAGVYARILIALGTWFFL